MPLSPGRISPRDMDDRQWATFVAQAGIQADSKVKTFTPTWSGFSADPAGDISYLDFGKIVILFTSDALTGTSNADFMTITNLPESIRPPSGEARFVPAFLVDNGTSYDGRALVLSDGNVTFYLSVVSGTKISYSLGGFTAASTKGLDLGTWIMYSK